ncbi:carbon-nitrogen hydrolase family protein [Mycolicibacterium arenosum]|uniref:Carbon-nitrogen hydrolase family protein n=1 Tax=Mycolicibacterium arenosum TaxID=2952157 RepID=A0ABT1LXD9_9MYCO|nr:carbon-nitrogen hydrolase family protein [Mycolicibacterium sp. CAU 1645]MCP9271563.1 carbon-nitrogen hydrolase family protein [Mycolicibacterium sp. CAU 1645]
MRVGRKLVVAAVQPIVIDGDVDGNVASHVEAITRADARLVVFPEMSLTGYRLDSTPVDIAGSGMAPLVRVCARTNSVALVGAPVEVSGGRFIAMVRIDGDGASVAYCKTFLHGTEDRCFEPGLGPRVIEVDGWRIGMGICRDTGTEEHVRGTAELGVDVYACGVVNDQTELAEQQRRGRSIAMACQAPVVMASFAGPTGGGFVRTAGRSAIWSADAEVLVEADDRPGDFVCATLRRSSGAEAVP